LADLNIFLAWNIVKKLDVNDYGFAHLTLILLLHYLVKYRSRSLAIVVLQSVRSRARRCVCRSTVSSTTSTTSTQPPTLSGNCALSVRPRPRLDAVQDL